MSQLKRYIIPAVLIFALWITLVEIRPLVIIPHCVAHPSECLSQSVNGLDRLTMGENNGTAEEFSNYGQITAGILALFAPLIFWFRKKSAPRRGISALQDLLIICQVIALNGALTELIRLIVQRPRPFVYENPAFYGQELQNYTSFVSGHTSFSTAAVSALVLVLVSRQAPRKLVTSIAILGGFVAVGTGICRVFAGRHFMTDVMAGAVCGLTSAMIIGYFWGIISCRRRPQPAGDSPTRSA